MAQVELIMPKMGESIMEATILTWLKKEGDTIEEDESVLEVATDKVDTEVPTTHGGVLLKILVQEGEVVEVGKPIALITTDVEEGASPATAPEPEPAPEPETIAEAPAAAPVTATIPVAVPAGSNGNQSNGSDKRFYSPLVKNIAKTEGITYEELSRIAGSGKEGRVTKKDILSYV